MSGETFKGAVTLAKGAPAGAPQMRVTFGNQTSGAFNAWLFDPPPNETAHFIGQYNATNQPYTQFAIGAGGNPTTPPDSLAAHVVCLDTNVSTFAPQAGPYTIIVNIFQQNNDVQSSPLTFSGTLDNAGNATCRIYITLN